MQNELTQTDKLLIEWNASKKHMLNSSYALDSSKCTLIEEKFDGNMFSRIHRRVDGTLILEERVKGSFSPRVWLIEQDFSELEALFIEKQKNNEL